MINAVTTRTPDDQWFDHPELRMINALATGIPESKCFDHLKTSSGSGRLLKPANDLSCYLFVAGAVPAGRARARLDGHDGLTSARPTHHLG
jgi:hypothetical protein